jgi:hypothetical protein
MHARPHHFHFAKGVLPAQAFAATQALFAELTGHRREAFLHYLWHEAGHAAGAPRLPSDASLPGDRRRRRLAVAGAYRGFGHEIVILALPPALQPNEAAFVALVRRGEHVSLFFYERCLGDRGDAVVPDAAVLAELSRDGRRTNHGVFAGVELADFKAHLGRALEISLPQMPDMLPRLTAPTAARTPAVTQDRGLVALLQALLLARAGLLVAAEALAAVDRRLLLSLRDPIEALSLLSLAAICVLLTVWLYRVHAAARGEFSPWSAVAGLLLPILNFVQAPRVVRSAYRLSTGGDGTALIFGWWALCLLPGLTMLLAGLVDVRGSSVPTLGALATVAAHVLLWLALRRVRAAQA